MPYTANGTELGVQEWRNALFLGYIFNPTDLPPNFGGFSDALFISRALDH